ncbi:MAG: hypothetical protein ACR2IH_00940 [Pyrinomonadaceae bacterium]
MKLTRGLVSLALIFSIGLISLLTFPMNTASAQDSNAALQRGYRTGYSDGYMAGYRDLLDSAEKNFSRHDDYARADRAFNKEYGMIEDYRDGYQQGFESGYDRGYTKSAFEAAIPNNLTIRGNAPRDTPVASAPVSVPTAVAPAAEATVNETPQAVSASPAAEVPAAAGQASDSDAPQVSAVQQATDPRPMNDDVITLPRDTELIIELQDELGTDRARAGDKFTAKVVSPAEVSGAMIEGRVERVQRPGRIQRRSEMLLSFDRIVVSENRWSNFNAILTEVLPVKGDNVRRVDTEGAAIGKSSVKEDSIKVGVATGAGAGIGAITAGPVGAAVGAGVGAAVGVGSAVVDHGKNIKLNRSQQLRIRSSYLTQIR